MTKTDEVRENIARIIASMDGHDDYSLSALDLGGYLEDADKFLNVCKGAGLVFVVDNAKVPQRRIYKRTVYDAHDTDGDIYRQGQIIAQQDMIADNWKKTKEIE